MTLQIKVVLESESRLDSRLDHLLAYEACTNAYSVKSTRFTWKNVLWVYYGGDSVNPIHYREDLL